MTLRYVTTLTLPVQGWGVDQVVVPESDVDVRDCAHQGQSLHHRHRLACSGAGASATADAGAGTAATVTAVTAIVTAIAIIVVVVVVVGGGGGGGCRCEGDGERVGLPLPVDRNVEREAQGADRHRKVQHHLRGRGERRQRGQREGLW